MIKLIKKVLKGHKKENKRYVTVDSRTKNNNEEMMLLLYTATLMQQM
ncbi:MAG: hypothetical protein MJ220_02205 [Bacilli bacterium]|nr:hypothetical protein [Bacilli bacterium]